MVSRNEERTVRDMGRTALEKAAKAALDTVPPGISRRFATVTKLYGNGTCDVDMGSSSSPQPMLGLRMTGGCAGVSTGSRVIVDTVSHVSLVTGVIATNNVSCVWSTKSTNARVAIGTVVKTFSGSMAVALTSSEIRSLIGRDFIVGNDSAAFMNGDYNANGGYLLGATFRQSDNALIAYAKFWGLNNEECVGLTRINYILVARG